MRGLVRGLLGRRLLRLAESGDVRVAAPRRWNPAHDGGNACSAKQHNGNGADDDHRMGLGFGECSDFRVHDALLFILLRIHCGCRVCGCLFFVLVIAGLPYLACLPMTPPTAAPPSTPTVLPPVNTPPATAPMPAPIAVCLSCLVMSAQAVIPSTTAIIAPCMARFLMLFIWSASSIDSLNMDTGGIACHCRPADYFKRMSFATNSTPLTPHRVGSSNLAVLMLAVITLPPRRD